MITGETEKRPWKIALFAPVSALCLFGLFACQGVGNTQFDAETSKPVKTVAAPAVVEEETGLLSNRDCVKCHSQHGISRS